MAGMAAADMAEVAMEEVAAEVTESAAMPEGAVGSRECSLGRRVVSAAAG